MEGRSPCWRWKRKGLIAGGVGKLLALAGLRDCGYFGRCIYDTAHVVAGPVPERYRDAYSGRYGLHYRLDTHLSSPDRLLFLPVRQLSSHLHIQNRGNRSHALSRWNDYDGNNIHPIFCKLRSNRQSPARIIGMSLVRSGTCKFGIYQILFRELRLTVLSFPSHQDIRLVRVQNGIGAAPSRANGVPLWAWIPWPEQATCGRPLKPGPLPDSQGSQQETPVDPVP